MNDRRIECQGLRLARSGFALGPLDLDVPGGQRLAIVGPSGSGKTTLLRCLSGLERPEAGAIRIGERTVFAPGTAVPPDRRGVGLVFQDGGLWPHLTALQHLRFAAPRLSRDDARELLRRGGLLHVEQRKPGSMSGGEAQRLGLLRALAARPAVLLLDEPLRSVDVHQRDALALLVRTFADELQLTTVLVTHDRDEALLLATDLVVLHDGRIVERGPAATLLRAPATAFTAAFLGGAACLPTSPLGQRQVATPFGTLPAPTDRAVQLVLLPGDVAAARCNGAPACGPRARVLASMPSPHGDLVRVAIGDQLVSAANDGGLGVGDEVELQLLRPPRLLPWEDAP